MNSESRTQSPADAKDRHARYAALGILLLGSKYAVDALAHFVSPTMASRLDYLVVALAAGTVLLILPMIAYKVFRLDRSSRAEYLSDESFTAHAFRRASVAATGAAIISMALLEILADDLETVPSEFFLQVPLALTLGAYSLAVLVLIRDPGEEDAHA